MNSYDVVIFNFMKTHPPIEHIQSVALSLYIYFGWFMGWVVDGGGVIEGFMAWVGGWWGGWLKDSWVGGAGVDGGFIGWVGG